MTSADRVLPSHSSSVGGWVRNLGQPAFRIESSTSRRAARYRRFLSVSFSADRQAVAELTGSFDEAALPVR
jgi:hypothetical protein